MNDVIERAKILKELLHTSLLPQIIFPAHRGYSISPATLLQKACQMFSDKPLSPCDQAPAHFFVMSGVRIGVTRNVSLS